MSPKVSQNFAVFVPEKCHLSQKKSQKIPERPQKNMACMHGTNRKGLSQGSCMPNINALSLILQKIWARLKFLWQTDGWTDGQMSFNVPRFRERQGTIMLWDLKMKNHGHDGSTEKMLSLDNWTDIYLKRELPLINDAHVKLIRYVK